MFCLFCLDARLNEGYFLFPLRTEHKRPPTAHVTACAPTLYEGSVIERHEGFLSWQGSCLQSQFVFYHAAFLPRWVLFLCVIQVEVSGIRGKESYLRMYL